AECAFHDNARDRDLSVGGGAGGGEHHGLSAHSEEVRTSAARIAAATTASPPFSFGRKRQGRRRGYEFSWSYRDTAWGIASMTSRASAHRRPSFFPAISPARP